MDANASENKTHGRSRRVLLALKGDSNWDEWKFKAQTHLMKKKLWEATTAVEPRPILVARSALDLQVENEARAALIAEEDALKNGGNHTWGNGDPPSASLPAIADWFAVRRQETDIEFELRKAKLKEDDEDLWSEVADCCEGEALVIAQTSEAGHGRKLWDSLHSRFGANTMSTQMRKMDDMFTLTQTGKIEDFVGTWRKTVADLSTMGLSFHYLMVNFMFLRALKPAFKFFVTINYSKDQQPEALYDDAIEYSKTALATGDEAMHDEKALFTSDRPAHWRDKCKHGTSCYKLKEGRCPDFHPYAERQAAREGRGGRGRGGGGRRGGGRGGGGRGGGGRGGKKPGDWNCQASGCNFMNFGHRRTCLKCDTPKSGGGGGMGKRDRDQANLIEELKTQVKTQKQQMTDAKDKVKNAMGLDVDLGYMVEEAAGFETDVDGGMFIGGMSTDDAMAVDEDGPKKIRMKVDSGATSNFVGGAVDLEGEKPCNTMVTIADGSQIHVQQRGRVKGMTSDGKEVEFPAKKSSKFTQNLFSPHYVAQHGCRTVLDNEESYIESIASGHRIPLERTESGWDLVISE